MIAEMLWGRRGGIEDEKELYFDRDTEEKREEDKEKAWRKCAVTVYRVIAGVLDGKREDMNRENNSKAQTEPIRQHIVPRLYLKNFAIDEKTIYAKQKDSGRIFKANIENIAVEKNFYTVNTLEDKYEWEKLYATVIEPKFQKMLQKIKFNGSTPLLRDRADMISMNEKQRLSWLIVFQMMRSKNVREYEKKLYEELGPKVINDIRRKIEKYNRQDLMEMLNQYSFDNNLLMSILFELHINTESIEKYATILCNKIWNFYCISPNSDMEFITSDNPIIILDSLNSNHGLFHCGMASNEAVICFPISPKILLAMYSYHKFWGWGKKYDLKKIMLSNKDKNYILNQNKQQLMQCEQFVIARTSKILEPL